MLYTREEVENAVWQKPPKDALEDEEVVSVTLFDVLKAFREVVKRFDAQRAIEIAGEEVSLEERMAEVRRLLLARDTILFSSFFDGARSRQYLIVTFLALLELVRSREVWLYQKQAFDEIYVSKVKSEEGGA